MSDETDRIGPAPEWTRADSSDAAFDALMREHASFLEPFKRPEDKAEVLKTAHKRLINAAADRVALSMQAPPAATRVEQALTGDAILDEPEDTPAVWGKGDQVLWARGEGLMIASHQGCGKTTLAQQLSLRLIGVDTSPFLGLPVEDDGRQVLYLAMDRPRQALRSMRRMVSKADTNVLRERLHIWRGPLPINVLGTQNALADWVSERYPDVGAVVVDSVKDLAPGVSEDAVGSGLNMSWQALIARGVDLLLLHHQRKAGNGAKRHHTLDDIYGSTWLTSGLGSVVALAGEPGAAVQELRHLKQPASPVELTLRHDHVRGRSEIHDGESEPIDLLREAGPKGLTVQQLQQRLGMSANTARGRLNGLVDDGHATRDASKVSDGGKKLPAIYRIKEEAAVPTWASPKP